MTLDAVALVIFYGAALLMPGVVYEAWQDVVAARPLQNGRLAVARVSFVRACAYAVFVAVAILVPIGEVRRLGFAALMLMFVVTEIYRRRAIRAESLAPRWIWRVWQCVTSRWP